MARKKNDDVSGAADDFDAGNTPAYLDPNYNGPLTAVQAQARHARFADKLITTKPARGGAAKAAAISDASDDADTSGGADDVGDAEGEDA